MFTKKDTLNVKGIAIILLLFHHLFFSNSVYQKGLISSSGVSVEIIQQLAIGARVCVWIFAFLSAYGLSCSYKDAIVKDIKTSDFLRRRYFQLMSPYWFVYIIFVGLSFVFFKTPFDVYGNKGIYLLLDFLGVADFFGTPMLSGVWWYTCFSQILLLLIPILVPLCRYLGPIGSYLLGFIILQYMPSGIHSRYGGGYENYLLVIILGVICAEYNIFAKLPKVKNIILCGLESTILLIGIYSCIYYKMVYADMDGVKLHTALSGFAAAMICILVYKYANKLHLCRILGFLGKNSGNMYLVHWFIYTYYPNIVYGSGNVVISLCTLLGLSCGVSIFLEYIKEKIKYPSMVRLIENKICGI